MQAKTPSELPYPFDGIQIRAVRREEVQTETCGIPRSPFFVENGMMVSRVVQDHYRGATGSYCNLPQAAQELQKGPGIKALLLALEQEFPVPQAHGSKVADTTPRWMMPQDRVGDLGSNPQATARAVLLKVYFVKGPEIHVARTQEILEFFLCSA
jgi:hypothetical protein